VRSWAATAEKPGAWKGDKGDAGSERCCNCIIHNQGWLRCRSAHGPTFEWVTAGCVGGGDPGAKHFPLQCTVSFVLNKRGVVAQVVRYDAASGLHTLKGSDGNEFPFFLVNQLRTCTVTCAEGQPQTCCCVAVRPAAQAEPAAQAVPQPPPAALAPPGPLPAAQAAAEGRALRARAAAEDEGKKAAPRSKRVMPAAATPSKAAKPASQPAAKPAAKPAVALAAKSAKPSRK
jgi:hypothetical protein